MSGETDENYNGWDIGIYLSMDLSVHPSIHLPNKVIDGHILNRINLSDRRPISIIQDNIIHAMHAENDEK